MYVYFLTLLLWRKLLKLISDAQGTVKLLTMHTNIYKRKTHTQIVFGSGCFCAVMQFHPI